MREAAAFVVKLTHSRTVSERDKAAILETLFTTRWTMTPDGGWKPEEQADPPLGKAVREDLFNGMLTARECVSQMLEDPSICEYLLHLANQLPGVTQIQRDGPTRRPARHRSRMARVQGATRTGDRCRDSGRRPATLSRADRLDHLGRHAAQGRTIPADHGTDQGAVGARHGSQRRTSTTS